MRHQPARWTTAARLLNRDAGIKDLADGFTCQWLTATVPAARLSRNPDRRLRLLNEALLGPAWPDMLWNAADSGIAVAFAQTQVSTAGFQLVLLRHSVRTKEEVADPLEDMCRERRSARNRVEQAHAEDALN